MRWKEITEASKPPTIVSSTMKNGEINRKMANRMVDPKGYFHPKAPMVTELFDTKGIAWVDDTHARFEVNGEPFLAWFKRDAGGSSYYDFMFMHETPDETSENGVKTTYGNTGLIGTGATKVFGYAIQCIEEFLARKQPRWLGFHGKKEDDRDQLYLRMLPMLKKRMEPLGYKISTKTKGAGYRTQGGVDFTLERTFLPEFPKIEKPKATEEEPLPPMTDEEWEELMKEFG